MEALPTKFVVSEHVLSSVAAAVGPRHVAGRACFVAFTCTGYFGSRYGACTLIFQKIVVLFYCCA